jgi:hypothetical protein
MLARDALRTQPQRDGEPRPADRTTPGGAYQYGYAGGGKLRGRRLETGVLPGLPVTRVLTTKQTIPRRILSRPVEGFVAS